MANALILFIACSAAPPVPMSTSLQAAPVPMSTSLQAGEGTPAASPTIDVVYINADQSLDRRETQEHKREQLASTPHGSVLRSYSRFPAVMCTCYDDATQPCELHAEVSAHTNATIEAAANSPGGQWVRQVTPARTRARLTGATTSHATVLRDYAAAAADQVAPYLLVLEDDAVPTELLLRTLPALLAGADDVTGPRGWHILRLDTWGAVDEADRLGDRHVAGTNVSYFISNRHSNRPPFYYYGSHATLVPKAHAARAARKMLDCAPAGSDSCGYMRVYREGHPDLYNDRDFVPVIAWTGDPNRNESHLVTISDEPSPTVPSPRGDYYSMLGQFGLA